MGATAARTARRMRATYARRGGRAHCRVPSQGGHATSPALVKAGSRELASGFTHSGSSSGRHASQRPRAAPATLHPITKLDRLTLRSE